MTENKNNNVEAMLTDLSIFLGDTIYNLGTIPDLSHGSVT